MATWKSSNSMLTQVGTAILNKVKAGNGHITVTRVVAGSGSVAESRLYTQTDISGSHKPMSISKVDHFENGSEISLYISNLEYAEPFNLMQIGIYVTHPDYEGEQLYHISQCDATDFDTIPAVTDTPVTFSYSLYLEHGNSESIVLNVAEDGYLLAEEFDKFRKGIRQNKLITVDSNGNLIASGKNTVVGTSHTITDATEHRVLSLSTEGITTQATVPSSTAPAPFLDSKVFDIRASKKNLFNPGANLLKDSVALAANCYGAITVTKDSVDVRIASNTKTCYVGILVAVEVGKTYTLSYDKANHNSVLGYALLDSAITDLAGVTTYTVTNPISITATKPILLIAVRPSSLTIGSSFGFFNVQVEEGSVATTYESYTGKIVTFAEPISIGGLDDYHDTIEWDGSKWWKVQRVSEVIIDGTNVKISSTGWTANADYTRAAIFSGNSSLATTRTVQVGSPVISTHGNGTVDDLTSNFFAYLDASTGVVRAHILNSPLGITSSTTSSNRVSMINNWFTAQNTAGTPVKIRFVLNTPVVTEISVTDVIEMFAGKSMVTCLSEVNAPNLRLGYALDTTDATIMYILDRLARKSDVQVANTFAVATLLE